MTKIKQLQRVHHCSLLIVLISIIGIGIIAVPVEGGGSLSSSLPALSRRTTAKSKPSKPSAQKNKKTTVATTRIHPTTNQRGVDANQIFVRDVYQWYLRSCTEKPLITKGLTCGMIAGLGDIIAQKLESRTGTATGGLNVFNGRRVFTFFLCNASFTGPFVHYWYRLIGAIGHKMQERYDGIPKWYQVLMQVMIDQTVGVLVFFPLYLFLYDVLDSIIQQRHQYLSSPTLFTDAYNKMIQNIYHVVLMQYRIFPISNTVNFAVVPEQLRVLFSNTVSLFWNIYLCSKLT